MNNTTRNIVEPLILFSFNFLACGFVLVGIIIIIIITPFRAIFATPKVSRNRGPKAVSSGGVIEFNLSTTVSARRADVLRSSSELLAGSDELCKLEPCVWTLQLEMHRIARPCSYPALCTKSVGYYLTRDLDAKAIHKTPHFHQRQSCW